MLQGEMSIGEVRKLEDAGEKKQEFEVHSMALADDGRKVIILRYKKAENLYVVIDDEEYGPAYEIGPDKLRHIEEENQERIPTLEEVWQLLEKLIGEAAYEEIRKLADGQGLYLWEIKATRENGSVQYSYMRKGDYAEESLSAGFVPETAIYRTYFDYQGVPVSDQPAFKLIDGEWIEVS
ncbi:MAG: hypothetical protein Q8L10_00785 [Candidatus Moranbacteria bacterium]|nr:hypothetical protein [Candidatus Moranbacteria bacterium]